MTELSLGNSASALQLDRAEAEQVSREATADNRLFIALHIVVIAMAVVAIAINWLEGDRLVSFVFPSFLASLSFYGLVVQTASRRERIQGILASAAQAAAVSYELSSAGIEIRRDGGATRLHWNEIRAFDETVHAFLLHTGSLLPEVLYKRAFTAEALTRARELLGANVKKRRVGRTIAITLAMGVGLMALGILLAVAVGGSRH